MSQISILAFLMFSSHLMHCIIGVDDIEAVNEEFFKDKYKEVEQTIINPILGQMYKCVAMLPSVFITDIGKISVDSDGSKSCQTNETVFSILIDIYKSGGNITVFTDDNLLKFSPDCSDLNKEMRDKIILTFGQTFVNGIIFLLKSDKEENIIEPLISFSKNDGVELIYHKLLSIHGIILNFSQIRDEYQLYLQTILQGIEKNNILFSNLDKLGFGDILFKNICMTIPKFSPKTYIEESTKNFDKIINFPELTSKQKFAVIVLKIISCCFYNSNKGIFCLEHLDLELTNPLHAFFTEYLMGNLQLTKRIFGKWMEIYSSKIGCTSACNASYRQNFVFKNILLQLMTNIANIICDDKTKPNYKKLKEIITESKTSDEEKFKTFLKCICVNGLIPSVKNRIQTYSDPIYGNYNRWKFTFNFKDNLMTTDINLIGCFNIVDIETISKPKIDFFHGLDQKTLLESKTNTLLRILGECFQTYQKNGYGFSKFTYISRHYEDSIHTWQSKGSHKKVKSELNYLADFFNSNQNEYTQELIKRIYKAIIKPFWTADLGLIFDPLFGVETFLSLDEKRIIKIFYEILEYKDLITCYTSIPDLFYMRLKLSEKIIKKFYFGLPCPDTSIISMIKSLSKGLEDVTFQGAFYNEAVQKREWEMISNELLKVNSLECIRIKGFILYKSNHSAVDCLLNAIGAKISVLEVGANVLTDNNLFVLKQLLSNPDSNLTDLTLYDGAISSDKVYFITDALKCKTCNLTRCAIKNANINSSGAVEIVESLKNSKLKILVLESNKIGYIGIKKIAEFLNEENCMLEFINLSHNSLSIWNAQKLAESLSCNSKKISFLDFTLTSIDFNNTDNLYSNDFSISKLYVKRVDNENTQSSFLNNQFDSIKGEEDNEYVFLGLNIESINIPKLFTEESYLNAQIFYRNNNEDLDSKHESSSKKVFIYHPKDALISNGIISEIKKKNFLLVSEDDSQNGIQGIIKKKRNNCKIRMCLFYMPDFA